MVEEVIDKGADVIVTITTQVAQIAVNATRDMEDPPAILFSLVTTPFGAGIADSTCIKPDHVTGTQPLMSFADYVPLSWFKISRISRSLAPSFHRINPRALLAPRADTRYWRIAWLTVEVASAITLADLGVATESLLSKGVEAIVLSVTPLTLQGTPVLVQMTAEYRHTALRADHTAGVSRRNCWRRLSRLLPRGRDRGYNSERHLSGDVDIADLAINQSRSFGVAINLDTAAESGNRNLRGPAGQGELCD